MKGLILAGGLGTRFYPLSHTGPKQLFPVANKPIIFHAIEGLKDSGIKEIGIVVGYTEERINALKEGIGDGSRWGVNITYIRQEAPKGLADAVAVAEEFIDGEDFIVYLGDNILKGGIKGFANKFQENDLDCMLLLSEVDDPRRYGVVVLDDENNIKEIEEKPENPKSNLAVIGIYFLKPSIFDFAKNVKPGKKGELQMSDAIKNLIESGKNAKAYKVGDWWDDLGMAGDVLRANHLLLADLKSDIKGEVDKNAKLLGNIEIGEGTKINEGSTIKGPVIIGKNCQIGPNAYIGPCTSIGNCVSIANAEIEASIILDGVKIDVKDKIIDSLIGKHATILSSNGLPKGRRLIVGENSDIRI